MSRPPIAQRCPVCDRAAARHRVNLNLVKTPEGGYDRIRDGVEHTDGKHRYDPFCTLRCALRFARDSHAYLTKRGLQLVYKRREAKP